MPFGGGGGFGGGGFGGGGGGGSPTIVQIISLRSGHSMFCRKARVANHIAGTHHSQILSIGTLFVEIGTLALDCVALRLGAHYEIPASAFIFTSQDGLFTGVNEIQFSGGGLQPSGLGPGTLVTPYENADPLPTTIFVKDV